MLNQAVQPAHRTPEPVRATVPEGKASVCVPRVLAHRRRAPAALLFALALLVYANALQCGFTWDDAADIEHNQAVTGGIDALQIFTSPFPPGNLYRPLTVLTFALNYRLGPDDTVTFHAVNVLLHAASTGAVFFVALALFASESAALIAAALFALHPIHTEAVTSLVGRAELLAALCGMLAMLALARADRARAQMARFALQLLSVVAFCLALLSKESALACAPLIFLFRNACRGGRIRDGVSRELRSLEWLPFALCMLVYLLLRTTVTGGLLMNVVTPLDNPLAFVPWGVRVRSAFGVLWDYFGMLNLPLLLGADYSFAQVPVIDTWTNARFLGGVVLVLAVLIVVVRDRAPTVTFATVMPLIALSLTANILVPIGTIKAERLLYFPSVGWILLLAYIADRLMRTPRYRIACIGTLLVVAAGFAARTWTRNRDWSSNATLCRSMVRTAPNSAKAHFNLGVVFQNEGKDEAAMVEFRRALEIYQSVGGASAALGIGIIYDRRHQTDQAIEWFRKALEIEPELGDAHTHLCGALFAAGHPEKAALACRRGLRYDPTDANLMKGLGESLIAVGDAEKGAAVLQRSLALNPADQLLRSRLLQLVGAPDRRGSAAVP